jgi:hypothetical protein
MGDLHMYDAVGGGLEVEDLGPVGAHASQNVFIASRTAASRLPGGACRTIRAYATTLVMALSAMITVCWRAARSWPTAWRPARKLGFAI